MGEFNIYEWNRKRHLAEASLNEEKSKYDLYLDMFIQELEGFDGGAADYLKNHRNLMIRNMQSIDFDSMNEEISDYEMVVYKVTVTLAEPGDGGPDYDEDVEVKVDASLSGDELRDAVRDAIGKEGYNRKNIYKFKYEKA